MDAQVRMARLTVVHGSFAAHVLAARLADEGLDVQLRGNLDGPYAVTVGDFARVDVYVPEDQLDDACTVLLDVEVTAALDGAADTERLRGVPPALRWVVWAMLAVAAYPFVRLAIAG